MQLKMIIKYYRSKYNKIKAEECFQSESSIISQEKKTFNENDGLSKIYKKLFLNFSYVVVFISW